jgi:hypothetical protein
VEVCQKLARSCQPVSVTPGSVIFQEDAAGDAMYVLMSGQCQVRAKPLPAAAAAAASGGGSAGEADLQAALSSARGAAAAEAAHQERVGTLQASLAGESAATDLLKNSTAAELAEKAVQQDGCYWTAKYMAHARSTATAADPNWGLGGGLTPLAAVFAAKWREKVGCHTMNTPQPAHCVYLCVLAQCHICHPQTPLRIVHSGCCAT